MSQARAPIRSVAVFGGGLVALSAAIAFARALPGVGVVLVETPADPAALADRLPIVLPAGLPFLASLGIDEDELVSQGAATHHIGTRYAGWRSDGGDGVLTLGDGAGVAFHHRWLAGRRQGPVAPYHHHLAAGALLDRDRFVQPPDDPSSPLASVEYALRLDPVRATAIFGETASRAGVRFASGVVAGIERAADGAVAAVLLDGGRRVSADLLLDCTGPNATLLSAIEDDGFDDWSDVLPCDRLMLATRASTLPSPVDHVEANGTGWRARWPLFDRTLVGLGYAAATAGEARGRRIFGVGGAEAEAITLRPGRRCQPWRRNVLALGDAAAVVGPLQWSGLPLAHAALALALDLLPARDMHPLELAEYNRRFSLRAERVRDFLALPYLAGNRPRGAFWRTRSASIPTTLSRTLTQFMRRGSLPHHEEESFDDGSWIAMLLGLDVTPESTDAVTLSASPRDLAAALTRRAAHLAAVADGLPPYPTYLSNLVRRRH